MKKRKIILASILPIVAATSIIGAGYSLFIFKDGLSISGTNEIGISVEQVAKIGSITVGEGGTKLNFDQTSSSLDSINPKGTGLTFTDASKTSGTYMLAADNSDDNSTGKGENVYIKFTTTISIPTALANYVELSSTTYTSITSSTETSGTIYTITESKLSTEIDSTNGYQFFDLSNLTPTYVSGAEPTTTSDHTSMKEAITDSKISVSYLAELSVKVD